MEEVKNYYFQNKLGIRIKSRDPAALHFYDQEYAHSRGVIPEDSSIVSLHWGKNPPPKTPEPGFVHHRHKWFARWSYRISATESGISIDAYGNKVAIPMLHHMLVHPALRLLAAQKGTLMLHGAAVVRNGQSLLFAGSGGSGKTTTSSLILHHGGSEWKLHADDYVFIVQGSQSLMYLTRAHLYRDMLKWLPQLRDQLTFREKMHLELFGRIRHYSRDGIKWPLRLAEARLWPNHILAAEAQLGAILLINREYVERPQLEIIADKSRLRADLLDMNFHEVRHFVDLVNKTTSNLNSKNWVERWKQLENDLLGECIRVTPSYRLVLPNKRETRDDVGVQLLNLLTPLTAAEGFHADR